MAIGREEDTKEAAIEALEVSSLEAEDTTDTITIMVAIVMVGETVILAVATMAAAIIMVVTIIMEVAVIPAMSAIAAIMAMVFREDRSKEMPIKQHTSLNLRLHHLKVNLTMPTISKEIVTTIPNSRSGWEDWIPLGQRKALLIYGKP